MEPGLKTHVSDGTATVTISNPGKRNAMTVQMWRALPPLLERLAADRGRTGAGADRRGRDVLRGRGHLLAAGAAGRGAGRWRWRPRRRWRRSPKPTLAAIRGYCVGGGCPAGGRLRSAVRGGGRAVRGDAREAGDRLSGVRPPGGWCRLVGPSAAKYLLFSGELIDARRALRTGLVDEVLAEGELGKRVAEFTRRPGVAVAADAGRGEGARERDLGRTAAEAGSAALLGRAGARERRHRGGCRRLPGAQARRASPGPRADAVPSAHGRLLTACSVNRLCSRSDAMTSAGAFSGEPAS